MSRLPYLPLYVGDFLAATAEWGGEERALYLLLLSHQWALGSLPSEPDRVRRVAGWGARVFRKCWPTVVKKFVERDGRLYNLRLEVHRMRSLEIAEKRVESGKRGARARWETVANRDGEPNGVAMANAKALPCHPIQTNPIKERTLEASPRRPARSSKSTKTLLPDSLSLNADLESYVVTHLPDADAAALFEKFAGQAKAKGWMNADWAQAFKTYVRNCAPSSGHFAAGQYPKASGSPQWQ
jgi:uncharacterized protein YdaU (DUF1376 family)